MIFFSASVIKPAKGNDSKGNAIELLKRDVDYVLPNGIFISDLRYRYSLDGAIRTSVGGSPIFGIEVLGGNWISFQLSKKDIGKSYDKKIEVPFKFGWEMLDYKREYVESVEHLVSFWPKDLK